MARKVITASSTTAPTTSTTAVSAPKVVGFEYPAQAPTGGKGRGIAAGSVGAALLQALANGPCTMAQAESAIDAAKASKGLRGSHPVQPLCRFIAVNGGVGLGFKLENGQLHLLRYTAPQG